MYKELTQGRFYEAVGKDPLKWTRAFREFFPDCNVDDGTMLGWFSNAIELAQKDIVDFYAKK